MSIEIILWVVILGLVFDYTNGFHDAANVVSTVIATGVLRPLSAIILAAILNTLGATQISGVAQTIASGLVQVHYTTQTLVLAALIGAISWNIITWAFGIPSSSSYALVGGLVGAVLFGGGSQMILWNGVIYKVIIPMVLSPIIGFVLGYLLMKGISSLLKFPKIRSKVKIFNKLQIISASLVAIAHGLNDAQKSMGIITLGLFAGGYLAHPVIPLWVILSCALMMGLGTASGGFRIIRTVGFEITKLEPFHGFAAETSASCVILAASFLGMPVSSTHMIVGSVTGVGSAKRPAKVQWHTAQKVILAWILTLPGAALVAGLSYKLFNLFGLR
ncbi:MAG: inorganic phosphate transporter [Rhabdochlamydiaceae bacterium]|nr:inorganic phosphate transporter [Rhabdochlamydiaceae bacterium]